MAGDRITIRVSPQLRRRLKAASRRNGVLESDVVRAALERQLDAEDDAVTAYERAKRDGIIGMVRGAPRDLSTNPKHFDGFGGS